MSSIKIPPFHKGQKVVYVGPEVLINIETGERRKGLSKEITYQVIQCCYINRFGAWYIKIVGEEEHNFNQEFFRPIEKIDLPLMKFSSIQEAELVKEEPELISMN